MVDHDEYIKSLRELDDVILAFIWGIIIIAFAVWILSVTTTPFNELELIRHAKVTEGEIYDASRDSNQNGATFWIAAFSFTAPNSKVRLTGVSLISNDVLKDFSDESTPYPVAIDYLPNRPSINRIHGSGIQTIWDWLRYYFGHGLFILAIFGVGTFFAIIGGKGIWKYSGNPMPTNYFLLQNCFFW